MYIAISLIKLILTEQSSSEDDLEMWNESCPDSEYESDHDNEKAPDLPKYPSMNTEKQRSEILSKWFMRFILIFQGKFYLPDKSIDFLLKFLYAFFSVIGNFSPIIKTLVQELPRTLHALKKKVGLSNEFRKYTVCRKCLSIYKDRECLNRASPILSSKQCTYIAYPNHPYPRRCLPCDATLLKPVEFSSGRTIFYPHLVYCYKSLKESLQSLLLNNDFVSNCHLWHEQAQIDDGIISSIYDGYIWKEFFNVTETPLINYSFSANKYSFGLALNIDWFQPYTHTTSSVGVMYITVLNLPRFLRYKRENVILIGLIPGPHEPKKDINSFLKPLVDELQEFWTGISLTVCDGSQKKSETVKTALLCVACDIPAGRKVCGFLGHSANLGCSKCLKIFPGPVSKKDYSGFDSIHWPKQTNEYHRESISKIKECKTKTKQKDEESKYGCRYSYLLELDYFDPVRMLCIDPMHNLFLGTGKRMLSIWEEQQLLDKRHFVNIQEFVDTMCVPSDIGRIPLKIASGFSGFTADQLKNWITIYSVPALFNVLPSEHVECWRHYVLACRISCKQCLSLTDVELAHHMLLRFCTKVECFYGNDVITPNMHLHGHLKEMLLDYGPSQELWLFSYKRYNGLLGKQPTNNKVIEPQLMQKFLRDNFVISLSCPEEFREEFSKYDIPERIMGSVRETLLPNNMDKISLPTKCKRATLNGSNKENLKIMFCKMHPGTREDEVLVNTIIEKYSSVCFKGTTFSTSTRNAIPYIAHAQWNESLFGSPPTSLPDSYLPTTNIRPVDIKYYINVTFTMEATRTITFAYVLWLLPHPLRYSIGKPAELWHNGLYEYNGYHTFLPVNQLICRCAHGLMDCNHETLRVVVPIVE